MKRQAMIYLSVFLIIILLIFLLFNQRSIQTITFFPIDNYTTFEKASTSLSLIDSFNNKSLKWETYSKSNQPAYLRQDVSLLFGKDRKSTRLNSSHVAISYAVFCLKKKRIKI